ncbi:DUF952 domain-containing protein [Albirhodobacter sp. R86504]|uniref:DUF952 domain-containing protein n=1 Tax=Albirhodobacter sp. R86504 TaxID=3093848 RepID=UPI00366D66AD
MIIYKIFRRPEWATFDAQGETLGASIDLADGYIHFSTKDQAAETAAKHFAGEDDLVLVALDAETLKDALVWEPSRGGQLFPHLYRALTRADCLWVADLPLGPDGHQFPKDMT